MSPEAQRFKRRRGTHDVLRMASHFTVRRRQTTKIGANPERAKRVEGCGPPLCRGGLMNILKAPTPSIFQACALIENTVNRLLEARRQAAPLGRFESEVEAVNLLALGIRHLDGVVSLARTDMVLLPPGIAAARAALESTARAAWMVQPDDPFERELRWLGHIQEEERTLQRLITRLKESGTDATELVSTVETMRIFREAVTTQHPRASEGVPSIPRFDQMLKALGGGHVYPLYIELSQAVHGTHRATWLYRKNLGDQKVPGEFIDTRNWALPLKAARLCLRPLSESIHHALGGTDDWMEETLLGQLDQVIEKILGTEPTAPLP